MKALIPQSRAQRRLRQLLVFGIAVALAAVIFAWAFTEAVDPTLSPFGAQGRPGALGEGYVDRAMLRVLEILIWLALLLPILYVSSLCHELGHAVMGRCAGYVVTTFGMGLGKPLLKLRVAGIHVYLANQSPFQGLTLVFQPRLVSRPVQAAAFCLGGVIANFLLVPLALLGWFLWPLEHGGGLWLLTAATNLVNSVLNLIPFRMRVGQAVLMTDGATLLYTLRAGQFPSAPVNTIAMVHSLRGLLRDIGDRLLHTVYLLAGAMAWRSLGSATRAEALCVDAAAFAGDTRPEVEGLFALARAGIAMLAGHPTEAAEFLDCAEALFKSLAHEAGLYYTSMLRAEHLMNMGDGSAAAALMEELSGWALVQARPAMRAEWVAAFIEVCTSHPNDHGLNRLRAEHETLSGQFPSVERDLAVYRALAVHAAERGDWIGAEPDFLKALDAAQQIHDRFALDADRTHFLEIQQTRLVDPARTCLVHLGKADKAELLVSRFRPQSSVTGGIEVDPGSKATAEVTAEVDNRVRRNRRYLGIGLLVGFLDFVVALIIILSMNLARDLPNNQAPRPDLGYDAAMLYGAFLLAGALVVLPLGGFWYLAGLVFPSLHKRLGWVVPVLAVAPWLFATLTLGMLVALGSE